MHSKSFILVILAVISLSLSIPDVQYNTKYDDIDLDEILNNKRLLNGYVKCLMDSGPCTPDGQELKRNLPDAITNDCSKCSEKQKIGSEKVLHHLINNETQTYDELEKKYDPSGDYRKKYLEEKDKE